MAPIISEIIKITVNSVFKLDSPIFSELRQAIRQIGVKEQYYGLSQEEPTTLFWVIQWLSEAKLEEFKEPTSNFRVSVKALDVISNPISWYLPFQDAELPRPALTAPVFELCTLGLKPSASRETLAESLHKTYTDCYLADGFTGGSWGIPTNEERTSFYYLGWKSRELHAAYLRSELCAVELNNLMPHMDSGWVHFMKMTRDITEDI